MIRNVRDRERDFLRERLEEIRRLERPSILLIRKAPQGIAGREGRLGVFPASFNPPTLAHLALIREAKRQSRLDEILLLLDLRPMDKKIVGVPLEERLIQLKLLFRRNPAISIGLSNRGLFLEKAEPLRALYPVTTKFYFIVGFDTVVRVLDEKYYSDRKKSLGELFRRNRFLVANRGEQGGEAFEDLFNRRKNMKYRGSVSLILLPRRVSSISSSLVRRRMREGKPVEKLVPSSILRSIEKTGLWKKNGRSRMRIKRPPAA